MGWYEYDSDNGYEYFQPLWYYAVAVGRSTGVYTKHEDAVEQVLGFPGFRMKKFDAYDDARDYLEEFGIDCDSETDSSGEEDEESEEELDQWFYAVAVGRRTGIYLNFKDAWGQIYGYPRSRMEPFLEFDNAETFLEQNQMLFEEEKEKSEEPGMKLKVWFYAVAVGRSTGVFVNYAEALEQVHWYSGFRMKKFRTYDEADGFVAFNQVYSSDGEEISESEEEEEEEEEKWYYAVAVGRRIGIYTDHQDAMDQVYGYSGFRMKKFLHHDEALEYVKENCGYYSSEEEEKREEQEQETWYYAVALGRRVGIYSDHQDAMDQVHGFSGFRMKKFLEYSEAKEYIDANQVHASEDEETSDEEEFWPQQEEEVWYYAVAVGRSPGIYIDHEEAMKQVHGYSASA